MLSGPSSRIPSRFVGWYATFVPPEAGQVQCRRASRAGIARCDRAWPKAETLSFRVQCRLLAASPREERVLRMRFGIGMKTAHGLEEVGQQFSLTRERIRQIEAKAQRNLKHPSRSRKLRSFLDN